MRNLISVPRAHPRLVELTILPPDGGSLPVVSAAAFLVTDGSDDVSPKFSYTTGNGLTVEESTPEILRFLIQFAPGDIPSAGLFRWHIDNGAMGGPVIARGPLTVTGA